MFVSKHIFLNEQRFVLKGSRYQLCAMWWP